VRGTGKPLASYFAAHQSEPLPWRLLPLALQPSDRAVLHERIAQRFGEMLDAGLAMEVERLRAKYKLHADLPSMRCVGYRQTWEVLEGLLPADELRDRGIFATRQFAKRQITWLRSMSDLVTLDSLDPSATDQALRLISEFLAAA
jgi:tRNA dimethylallyltransferase